MKKFKQLKEDIGLSTGAGMAMYDPMLGGTRRQVKPWNVYKSLGVCEECMLPIRLKEGEMTCPGCNKILK